MFTASKLRKIWLGLVNPFIFLVYTVASVYGYGYIIEFVPYLETYVIEPFGLVSSILLLGFQAKLALSIN